MKIFYFHQNSLIRRLIIISLDNYNNYDFENNKINLINKKIFFS